MKSRVLNLLIRMPDRVDVPSMSSIFKMHSNPEREKNGLFQFPAEFF